MTVGPYFPYNLSAPVVAGAMVSYSSHKLGIVSLILSSISIITGSIQMTVGPYFPYNLGAPVVAGSMVSYSSHKLDIVNLVLSFIAI